MTVIVTKDAINLREKLSELDKETGIKGEELMRADTSAEAREALQLDQQLFTDFESTGIDDNATSTAVTIDSLGNVGIGTSSPLAAGSSYTVVDIGSASTASLLNMTDNGTETGRIVAQSNQLHFSSGTASGVIAFRTGGFSSGDEAMRIDSSGHAIIPNGVTLGTAAGTYNAANTLDDYEEGLWTPLLVPLNGAFTSQTIINYLTDKPRYTKIGNLVMVSVLFTTYELTKGTGSGNVYLGGLPFTVYTSSAATISNAHDFLGDKPSSGSVGYQSDEILLKYRTSSNGEDVNLQVTDLGTTDGSNSFILTMVYRTNE